MDLEKRKADAGELSRAAYGEGTPLKSLFMRVVALLGDAPVVARGGNLRWAGRRTLSGQMYFFTDQLLLVATLHDFAAMNSSGNPEEGDVDIQVLPRSALSSVQLRQAQTNAAYVNTYWQHSHSDEDGWAPDGAVDLHYDGLSEPLTLLVRSLTDWADTVPQIVADLSRV
jgi:hypothetical protein